MKQLLGILTGVVVALGMAPAAAAQLTQADLNAFLDGQISLAMQRDDIAGMEVAVVKDGELLALKGYGTADRARGTPVDPRHTLFRVGSISKTFTAMAVMRLVEAGKLDLDRDVNGYLDFKIEPAFSQPVTLRQLLTHTAGFEETLKGLYAPNQAGIVPLRDYLVEHQPQRIFPPGTVAAYSNYGFALAGYIVQRVSGMPYATFMEREILSPLGMKHSSFNQPPSQTSDTYFAAAYEGASKVAEPFEYLQIAPAGSLSTTAEDMSRYMIAHLERGSVGDLTVLRPETLEALHTRQFNRGAYVGGLALSWQETTLSGRRALSHGGATLRYLAYITLVPDEHLGIFLVQNSGADRELQPTLVKAVMDRYFPQVPAAGLVAAAVGQVDPGVAGVYQTVRRNESSVGRLFAFLRQTTVTAVDRGVIEISTLGGIDESPVRWRRIAPLVYRDCTGEDVVQFRTDQRGQVVSLIGASLHVGEFQKLPLWYHAKVLAGIVLVAAIILIRFILLTIKRMRAAMRALPQPAMGRRLDLALLVSAACALIVVVLWPAVLINSRIHLDALDSRLDLALRLLQAAGMVAALGVPIAAAKAGWITRCGAEGCIGLLPTLLTGAALTAFTWAAWLTHFFSLLLRY